MLGARRILYRPAGLREMELVARSGWRRWPPRLPSQPFFYPTLSADYARTIARDWNTKDEASGYVGFVTAFEVDPVFVDRYPVRIVGAKRHSELWVPAEDLEAFNDHILHGIQLIDTYKGPNFREGSW